MPRPALLAALLLLACVAAQRGGGGPGGRGKRCADGSRPSCADGSEPVFDGDRWDTDKLIQSGNKYGIYVV